LNKGEGGGSGREAWAVAATLAVLVLLGSYVRISGLPPWHLAWDEAWHLLDALQASPLAVILRNVQRQVHGPVGYLLWYATAQLTSDPFGLRFVSLLPGLMLIPTFYVIGRELFGRGAGIFLAVIAAFAAQLIVLSQLLRPYAPMLLLLSLALAALLLFERTRDRRALVAYGVSTVLASLTHVSALVPVSAVAAWWTLRARGGDSAVERPFSWAASHTLLALCIVGYSYAQLHFAGGEAPDPTANHRAFVSHFYHFQTMFPDGLAGVARQIFDMYQIFFFAPNAPGWLAWVLIFPTAVGVVCLAHQRRFDALALTAGVLGAGALLGLLEIYPFAATRHSIYLVLFLVLPAAYSVQLLSSRWPLVAALVGLAGIGLLVPIDAARYRPVRVDFDTQRADLDRTFDYLEGHAGEGDVVVVNRVGMLYLNLEERLFEHRLEHVRHDPDHSRYEFDRWVAPGEEEHRFRGTTFWGCDGVHEWSSFLRGGQAVLEQCLEQLARSRAGRQIHHLWFLVEKPDLFLAFTTTDPIRSVPADAPGRRELEHLRRVRFWRVFFDDAVERFRTPTAGTFALRWAALAGELGSDRRRPHRARPE
jgi:4-amino-4-deoxy-L-arabinose transferase-like glycosyltransferase